MSITKTEVFRKALTNAMSIPPEYVHQVSYYTDDLDTLVEEMSGMAAAGWRKFRRTEHIRVYPGGTAQQAVFYVAHHHEYMPGFETELIQPLTVPNYIKILEIAPRQIAHLSVLASTFDGELDRRIIYRICQSGAQLIQQGQVRVGRKLDSQYSIYNVDNFLPIKIIR